MGHTLLIVDDEPDILEALRLTFEDGFDVYTASSGLEGLAIVRDHPPVVIIADQRMPEMTGDVFLAQVREIVPESIRIMLTGYTDLDALIRAVNEGHIYQYMAKPWEPEELRLHVQRGVERYELSAELEQRYEEIVRLNAALEEARQKLEQENIQLRQVAQERHRFDGLIGSSPAMEAVYDLTERILKSDVSVMLTGSTGTGKEMLAKVIHFSGHRKDGPFVAQNCGALPAALLESELFGHRKGSFTGAIEDRPGLFETADGGTVFLDEIGETTPEMQVRLLRVLQEGEIRRVGETVDRKVNVRVVAATNRDLRAEVAAGRFREDLFFRLNVFPIRLPSLKDRVEDIPLLSVHFLTVYAPDRSVRFTAEAIDVLCRYNWPGNVRELENEVQRALLIGGDVDRLGADTLSESARGELTAKISTPVRGNMKSAQSEMEKTMITQALQRHKGNRTHAARALGISRWGLVQKIQKYEIG
ncbi:MAG: two-component system response regulator HupR/HoxA [Candidatus Latescibacterota bacterium]|jgi:two-component system response regulator HupR/HoxA